MLRQKDADKPLCVSDLIACLQTLPPDAVVVQSRDSEGNGFSPTHELCLCRYLPDSHQLWIGVNPPAEALAAICFWPAN